MFDYKLFAIGMDGVRKPGRDLQFFLDDAKAIAAAQSMSFGYLMVEVWLGTELIGATRYAPRDDGTLVSASA